MNRTVAVIQARTGSNRFPGKVLAPIHDDVSLLAFQIRRLRQMEGVDELVIATTQSPNDDAIAGIAEAEGIRIVRGPEEDVLDRFIQVADQTLATTIVRITSDCPFRDPSVIEACVAEHKAHGAEYTRPKDGHLPKGMRAEVVETAVLRQIHTDTATTDRDREHVTIRVRENPAAYRCFEVDFPESLHHPEFDLSVDTREDLVLVQSVYKALTARDWPVDAEHVCRLLEELNVLNTIIKGLAS